MKPLLILRPEPGNSATAARARALGLTVWQRPLFAVEPVAWEAPDPRAFDHLLLTSANAVRHAGSALAHFRGLDVLAVGPATATTAREAGLRVTQVGDGGVEALLADVPADRRLLHLTAAEHRPAGDRHQVHAIVVYRARPLTVDVPPGPCVAAVHSPAAGASLADLMTDRSAVAVAAISNAAASACGSGWADVQCLASPDETALLALAARLCQE